MIIFFFKPETSYELRISDWSSDVCSSDLADRPEPVRPETAGRKVYVQRGKSDGDVQRPVFRLLEIDRGMIEILGHTRRFRGTQHVAGIAVRIGHLLDHRIFGRSVVRIDESGTIGRESCRERVCKYV